MDEEDNHETAEEAVRAAVLACVRSHRSASDVELELRLGRYEAHSFLPGVDRVSFEEMEEDMRADDLLTLGDEGDMVDVHYSHAGRRVRTRVVYDSEHIALRTEHVHKRPLFQIVVCASGTPCAVRLSSSVEERVEDAPTSCLPQHVRVKHRASYVDRRASGAIVWSYDLSRTHSGRTHAEADRAQKRGEVCYEVECELVDEDGSYLRTHDDEALVDSLLVKLRMLLGVLPTKRLDVVSTM